MRILAPIPLLFALAFSHTDTIPSAQAKDHIGETATVCGHVADTRYLDTGSHVTFLNFDKPYPNHTFTAFIPAESRAKFGMPEKEYWNKDACVTGKIQDYRGRPEIVLTDPTTTQSTDELGLVSRRSGPCQDNPNPNFFNVFPARPGVNGEELQDFSCAAMRTRINYSSSGIT